VSTVGPGEAESACARFGGPWSEDTLPLLGAADECGLLEGIESLCEMCGWVGQYKPRWEEEVLSLLGTTSLVKEVTATACAL
jgi:hypothetical protein